MHVPKTKPSNTLWFGQALPTQPVVSFLILVVPPISTNHGTNVITEGFGDVEAGHGIGWDGLSHSFHQNFFPSPGEEFFFPALD
jgi:hypothetical protein